MKQSKVETYLGKRVLILSTKGLTRMGYLAKDGNGYRLQEEHPPGIFLRCSHIKEIILLPEKEETR